MKKLFFICCLAATIFALDSCKKKNEEDLYKPKANFNYTTEQISGGVAIKCHNYSTNATSYEWRLDDEYNHEVEPTFYIYSPGTYYLGLTAMNEYGSDHTYKAITIKKKPSGYEVTSLKLTKIPMRDSNNDTWDTGLLGGTDPDIFFKIMDENKVITYCTGECQDNVSTLPISWNITNTQLEIGTKYIIQFLDYDEGLDLHDIMANCVWQVKASQEGQTTYNWNAQDGTIRFVVGFKWLYPSKGEEQLICVEESDNEVIGEIE